MKRLFSAKTLAVAAVALGAIGVTSAAQARTDVALSIGIPFGYVRPAPVYVQPQPVYVEPQVYVEPSTVYYSQPPVYYAPGYASGYVTYDRGWAWRQRYGHPRGPWGDADRDGVPNRFDNAPHNPYRR
jgi:hypothetical protein